MIKTSDISHFILFSVSFSCQKKTKKFIQISKNCKILATFRIPAKKIFIEFGFVIRSINNNLHQRCLLNHLYPDLFFALIVVLQDSCKNLAIFESTCKILNKQVLNSLITRVALVEPRLDFTVVPNSKNCYKYQLFLSTQQFCSFV